MALLRRLGAWLSRVWTRFKKKFEPFDVAQGLWLIAKEIAAVAFATRVPTLVVALVFALLAITEPAQDMLSEAALDIYQTSPTTLPFFQWYRLAAIVLSLILLGASAWYWSRVALLYERIMPDLPNNPEGVYRSEWRPAIVLWWPRLIGTAVFAGCVFGLVGATIQYAKLNAQGHSLWLYAAVVVAFLLLSGLVAYRYIRRFRPARVPWWQRLAGSLVFAASFAVLVSVMLDHAMKHNQDQVVWLLASAAIVSVMGAAFLRILVNRRSFIPKAGIAWALQGTPDARAPYRSVLEILDAGAAAAPQMRRVGGGFIAITLFGTPLLLIFAGVFPVTLGDGLGGLATAQLAAAITIPPFTALTIASATNRIPLFGLAVVWVLAVPSINSWLADRIDNHDVRTLADTRLPERWTMDEVYDQWFAEHQKKQKIVYSSSCQKGPHNAGDCRKDDAVKACRDDDKCKLWKERPPFVVVAAEGGASRAGYWTALSVGEMLRQDPDMRDSIFAISSVSGGTLGAVLIRALIDLDRLQESKLGLLPGQRVTCASREPDPQPYLSCARLFMRRDFLASAFTGMFYTDLVQRFIPSGVLPLPDRAETIERSWETSWDDVIANLLNTGDADFRKSARNLFGKGFLSTWGKDSATLGNKDVIKPWPVMLLNGTNVETGRRVITSNVDAVAPASRSTSPRDYAIAMAQLPCVAAMSRYGSEAETKARLRGCSIWEEPAVDDPFTILEADMPISTAANMSARFPVVQPAGGITGKDGKRAYHVVDGGIYENFGAQTINDLLRYFLIVRVQTDVNAHVIAKTERDWGDLAHIRPLVVLVSTDQDLDGVRQVAPAYGGKDDRVDGKMGGHRNPDAERKMRLGCEPYGDKSPDRKADVPLCKPKLMKSANEVLGDAVALYDTRSGRGESGILSLRETLATTNFYDENFFHFRQCINGMLRPASMTWYVSGASRIFMSELLPSVFFDKEKHDLTKVSFEASMKFIADNSHPGRQEVDACQNHAELKRLIDRYDRIKKGER
jgi:hypothetical protein